MKRKADEGTKRLIAEIPASLHLHFKTEIYRKGLNIQAVIEALIKSWLSKDSKMEIEPDVRNPGESIEEIVERVIDKKLAEIEGEEESAAEPVDVHNVAEPVEVEEPEEVEELEEFKEPEEVEVKPKKKVKKQVGIWPWIREVEVDEDEDEEEPAKRPWWR